MKQLTTYKQSNLRSLGITPELYPEHDLNVLLNIHLYLKDRILELRNELRNMSDPDLICHIPAHQMADVEKRNKEVVLKIGEYYKEMRDLEKEI